MDIYNFVLIHIPLKLLLFFLNIWIQGWILRAQPVSMLPDCMQSSDHSHMI